MGQLLDFRATYAEAPKLAGRISPVRITLPDGESGGQRSGCLEQILSRAFSRDIAFVEARAERMTSGVAEEYWPDMAGLEHRDTLTDSEMPAGTFFDIAVVHLLTTSTIDRLRELYPQGRFEARRFRLNIVMSTGSEDPDFVENDWIGRTVLIGDTVRLAITEPCPRCVMITLPQGDLPKDSGILRTAAQHNGVNVGVYASVVNGGTIRRGDTVVLA
ncbi:MAG TPA: MOSC domain-containing protein [Propionibacteriaceae bacterium]|nr:MOSC domain-containing protein [Propionibacteriaceae bacterium]